jgi:O-acetyl-ADP-ribose deacetylase (regulator of RNase III)
MKYITGDLIELAQRGEFDVMVHGCNCFCRMGSGIAAKVKEVFPHAWHVDQQTLCGDRDKLGTITVSKRSGPIIVNAYTQFNYGYDGKRYLRYKAVRSAFNLIFEKFGDKRIGIPKIGAGLAGGDWSKISRIIDEEMEGVDLTCVEYVEH